VTCASSSTARIAAANAPLPLPMIAMWSPAATFPPMSAVLPAEAIGAGVTTPFSTLPPAMLDSFHQCRTEVTLFP
jgi:hypothetical protein